MFGVLILSDKHFFIGVRHFYLPLHIIDTDSGFVNFKEERKIQKHKMCNIYFRNTSCSFYAYTQILRYYKILQNIQIKYLYVFVNFHRINSTSMDV